MNCTSEDTSTSTSSKTGTVSNFTFSAVAPPAEM